MIAKSNGKLNGRMAIVGTLRLSAAQGFLLTFGGFSAILVVWGFNELRV